MEREQIEILVGKQWSTILYPLFQDDRMRIIEKELAKGNFYPRIQDVFLAFRMTPLDNVDVMILGMDPYIDSSAIGLSFGSKKVTPSLRNILHRVEDEFGQSLPDDFDTTLKPWAEQGVLLLNTALTVRAGQSGSHIHLWKWFTEELLKEIQLRKPDIIYILWGKHAQSFNIWNGWQIKSGHPSPLNRTIKFEGGFKEANTLLKQQNKKQINWLCVQ